MSHYKHILVALDFTPEHIQVKERAAQLARQSEARLSLIHVVEFVNIDPANELVLPTDIELEGQIADSAKSRLREVAESLDVPGEITQWVEAGSTRQEIIRVAEEQGVDLIVLGSHGRHGIGLLLGSTANAVLHGAPCDVLAVRIQEK
jgi:universal stress protein A